MVEAKIQNNSSTAQKVITVSSEESDRKECSNPSAKVEPHPPRIVKGSQGGDDLSVFTNLAIELEGPAEEANTPTCNSKLSTETVVYSIKLPSYPTGSCRMISSGHTLLNFQWGNK